MDDWQERVENFLGNLFVDTDFQDRGIGLKTWRYIEGKYPETRIWRTETPGFSKRNHNFYVNKCGFRIVKILHPGDRYEESYLMEKPMACAYARPTRSSGCMSTRRRRNGTCL